MTTSQDLSDAVSAYGRARRPNDVVETSARIKALTPPGLMLRPSHNGNALNVHMAHEPGQSMALFYLCQPRQRQHDQTLVAMAWAAICGMAAALQAKEA